MEKVLLVPCIAKHRFILKKHVLSPLRGLLIRRKERKKEEMGERLGSSLFPPLLPLN